MRIILTVDKKNGLSFMGKRQSYDRAVYQYILDHYAPLSVNDYALAGMKKSMGEDVSFEESPETLFLEGDFNQSVLEKASDLVVFNWNRDYPHDKVLDMTDWKKVSQEKFAGNSHEKITVTEYRR